MENIKRSGEIIQQKGDGDYKRVDESLTPKTSNVSRSSRLLWIHRSVQKNLGYKFLALCLLFLYFLITTHFSQESTQSTEKKLSEALVAAVNAVVFSKPAFSQNSSFSVPEPENRVIKVPNIYEMDVRLGGNPRKALEEASGERREMAITSPVAWNSTQNFGKLFTQPFISVSPVFKRSFIIWSWPPPSDRKIDEHSFDSMDSCQDLVDPAGILIFNLFDYYNQNERNKELINKILEKRIPWNVLTSKCRIWPNTPAVEREVFLILLK